MTPLQESIAKCTVNGNVVSLPKEMLPNYQDVRTALLKAGATYKKNAFIFPNEAQPYIDRLLGGESVNRKKETQFFATPDDIADYLVDLAQLDNHSSVLEPSAGQGAIIKAILKTEVQHVDYCETDEINRNVLSKMSNVRSVGTDFLKFRPRLSPRDNVYDTVIANPPFSKNADIDHIRNMYAHLKPGGRVVSVASKHWQISSNKKETEFRQWLKSIDAEVIEIEAGRFRSSGTMIATCIIVIDK